jgi:hypothetical protein
MVSWLHADQRTARVLRLPVLLWVALCLFAGCSKRPDAAYYHDLWLAFHQFKYATGLAGGDPQGIPLPVRAVILSSIERCSPYGRPKSIMMIGHLEKLMDGTSGVIIPGFNEVADATRYFIELMPIAEPIHIEMKRNGVEIEHLTIEAEAVESVDAVLAVIKNDGKIN